MLLITAVVQAGSITPFSNQTSFDTAAGAGLTVETFDYGLCLNLTGPISSSTTLPCGLPAGTLQPGATYSAPISGSNSFNIDSNGFDPYYLDGSAGALTVTFGSPVAFVGFDTEHYIGTAFTITINFQGGGTPFQSTYSAPTGPTLGFYGWESS